MAEATRNLVVVITRGIDHEPSSLDCRLPAEASLPDLQADIVHRRAADI